MKWGLWLALLWVGYWRAAWAAQVALKIHALWLRFMQLPGDGLGSGRWIWGALLPTGAAVLLQLLMARWGGLDWLLDLALLWPFLELRGAIDVLRQGRSDVGSSALEERLAQAWSRAFDGVFCVTFWFLVLPGASGVVLVKTVAWLAAAENDDGARRIRAWIDWLPARVLALMLALVGNFEETLFAWRAQPVGSDARAFIAAVALSALGIPVDGRHEDEALELDADIGLGAEALLWRTLIVWGGLAALLTALRL